MARRLVIEMKVAARVTDGDGSARKCTPLQRRAGTCGSGNVFTIGRRERIQGQEIFDVHQEQLLMLLFMMQTEFDSRAQGLIGVFDDLRHARIDVGAIVQYLAQ